jgi:hypothetical protein
MPQVTLSAQTARLASTPDPRGRPGGPGLYFLKGNKHSDYMEHIVKALIRAGHPPDAAYRIAWGALRRWAKKRKTSGEYGHVHPEVQAASAAALGQEAAASAKARAAHGHANTLTGQLIELATAAPAAGSGTWHGLGKGKGWIHEGPETTTPTKAQQVKTLNAKLKQVNLAITAAHQAINNDEIAKSQAQVALNAAKQWAAGGFTTTGGSTASGSSTSSTTSATTGTTTTTSASGTTTKTSSSGVTYPTVASAQANLDAASSQLAKDEANLSSLISMRTSLQKQILQLGGVSKTAATQGG